MSTIDFLCKKLEIFLFYGGKSWEKWDFSGVYLFLHYGFVLVRGNCEWKWCTIGNIAHFMNGGMLGEGELCNTCHNNNTHWENKLERHLLSFGDRTFAPDSK